MIKYMNTIHDNTNINANNKIQNSSFFLYKECSLFFFYIIHMYVYFQTSYIMLYLLYYLISYYNPSILCGYYIWINWYD